jgi:ribosomal protein S18 acetylase RimI-like enzyme
MAARIEPAHAAADLIDLHELSAADLEPLLEEEIDTWRHALQWDFRKSAGLVRRFLDLRALSGYALVAGRSIAGYAYFVLEEHKALIGDLYVRRAAYAPEIEARLLHAVLRSALESPQVRRIEAQLMMMVAAPAATLPASRYMRQFDRSFMLLERLDALALPPGAAAAAAHIERWTEPFQEAAAQLIADAYRGHIDALINDQYRTPGGARRFLYNIVQYPGCGAFAKSASFAAFEPRSGRMTGMCLSSMIGPRTGHITQICVRPQAQGTGIGYELLRRSIDGLREAGCQQVSLTVTSSNPAAVRLYERIGFRATRRFLALAWEGF